jgi:hypothetical protein
LLIPAGLLAQATPECCKPLLLPIGARALALMNAVSARTDGSALFVNPALIAELEHDEFFVHNANTAIETSNTFSLLLHTEVPATFGVSYRLIDYGEQEASQDPGGPTGVLTIREHVLTLSFATRVTSGLNAGGNYKLYQFRQDCRGFCGSQPTAATTHGIDVGVQYRPDFVRGLETGFSFVHLGLPLQVVNYQQADPNPARLRVGVAYEALHHFQADTTAALWVMTDISQSLRAAGADISAALELALQETIYFWAGYGSGSGLLGGTAAGVGIHYDRFDVGVAKSFTKTELLDQGVVHISFGIRF